MRFAKTAIRTLWIGAACLLAASCGHQNAGRPEVTVLIRMMDIQDRFFRNELMAQAEDELGVRINVVTFDRVEDIERLVRNDLEAGRGRIALVKTAQSEVAQMVRLGLVKALDEIVPPAQLAGDLAEYVPAAVEFGTLDGRTWYIPRKLECNVLLYLKSEVADAVDNWEGLRDAIELMFKRQNGHGLPAGYTLEPDPNQWDWYDLAVVAAYWASTQGDDGRVRGRMAHRGKDYSGTTFELLTKLYQAGGDERDFYRMTTEPALDVFEWESFYVLNGLYNPDMWQQQWSGGGIWKGFVSGQVYAAFMHQIDAFFIHGGSHPTMQGYLRNPADMGLAVMPRGASLALDADGRPLRTGRHASNFAGWWWGIPVSTPDPQLSYRLARFITNRENHRKECATFGMLPIRKDVRNRVTEFITEPWMREVFEVGWAQFESGVVKPPRDPHFDRMGAVWRRAWYDVAVDRHADADLPRVDRDAVRKALDPYAGQIAELREAP